MGSGREAPDAWTVARSGAGLVLTRDLECQICCKRKRDRCSICHGTGRRTVPYELTADAARALLAELRAVLGEGAG